MNIEYIRMRPEGLNDYGTVVHPETSVGQVLGVDGKPIYQDYVRNPGYGVASGTNAKTVTLNPSPTSYVEGMGLSFKNTSENTGSVTVNVNGLGAKPILKSNGNQLSSGNLKAGSVYTIRYDGSNFILQGEGGEYGTAQASDVLEGKTIGTEDGIITGTMPNRGSPTQTLTTQGGQYNIPVGYYSGGWVKAQFANLIAGNIKKGVNIGGIVGSHAPIPRIGNAITSPSGSIENSRSFSLTVPTGTVAIIAFISREEARLLEANNFIDSFPWTGVISQYYDSKFELRSITRSGNTLTGTIYHLGSGFANAHWGCIPIIM